MRGDRWRLAAFALLAACLAVVLTRSGDGIGGDTHRFVASAENITGDSPYPPGMAFLLAPFTESLFAMRMVMLAVTVALVTVMWCCAVRLGGWRSGTAAGGFMLLSKLLITNGSVIMSDRFGALFVVLALLALIEGRTRLAGVLVALSGWVRLAHLAFCAALPRRAWAPAAAVGGLLFAWQLAVHGNLVGYSGDQASWSLEYITGTTWLEVIGNPSPVTNLAYYPGAVVFLLGWTVPGAIVAAAVAMWRRRDAAARFAAGVIGINLLVYVPFFFQSTRYVLPACCMVTIFAAAAFGEPSESGNDAVEGDLLGSGRAGVL